jgi:predicted DNA-binding protein (MmcQ/YjbR family)
MNYAAIEKLCLSLPGTTLEYPFGPAKVFKVGGKMFALISIGERGKPEGVWFKAGETSFAILTRIKGIMPCPYLARAHWVAMEGLKSLTPKELRAYLIRAHGLAAVTLSKKKRQSILSPD